MHRLYMVAIATGVTATPTVSLRQGFDVVVAARYLVIAHIADGVAVEVVEVPHLAA
ncbi:hypothetical protein [uncultured Microbulbifer sp.]|uniref:hypothetical protein n=1 Tax=uncultured Microbulbifer sp. TaxID=348147 RepID=UPI00261D3717|nr:hypothetical protein [uncultured Microbulbifer sp.]